MLTITINQIREMLFSGKRLPRAYQYLSLEDGTNILEVNECVRIVSKDNGTLFFEEKRITELKENSNGDIAWGISWVEVKLSKFNNIKTKIPAHLKFPLFDKSNQADFLEDHFKSYLMSVYFRDLTRFNVNTVIAKNIGKHFKKSRHPLFDREIEKEHKYLRDNGIQLKNNKNLTILTRSITTPVFFSKPKLERVQLALSIIKIVNSFLDKDVYSFYLRCNRAYENRSSNKTFGVIEYIILRNKIKKIDTNKLLSPNVLKLIAFIKKNPTYIAADINSVLSTLNNNTHGLEISRKNIKAFSKIPSSHANTIIKNLTNEIEDVFSPKEAPKDNYIKNTTKLSEIFTANKLPASVFSLMIPTIRYYTSHPQFISITTAYAKHHAQIAKEMGFRQSRNLWVESTYKLAHILERSGLTKLTFNKNQNYDSMNRTVVKLDQELREQERRSLQSEESLVWGNLTGKSTDIIEKTASNLGLSAKLIENSKDLRLHGYDMFHCVGGDNYVNMCLNGDYIVIATTKTTKLKNGEAIKSHGTIGISRPKGFSYSVNQVRGYNNSAVDKDFHTLADNIVNLLNGAAPNKIK